MGMLIGEFLQLFVMDMEPASRVKLSDKCTLHMLQTYSLTAENSNSSIVG
jgi:hypothetical protein